MPAHAASNPTQHFSLFHLLFFNTGQRKFQGSLDVITRSIATTEFQEKKDMITQSFASMKWQGGK